jgi:error-prone DNA polymerase
VVPYSVELHLHTCYSFLEGASLPEELADRAAELGYTALAITDHDGLHGAMQFAQACAAAHVQPITGVELTLKHGLSDPTSGPVHLTLLAEREQGYANLCRLITLAHHGARSWEATATHLPAEDPRPAALDPADLARHTEGLIVLSGCRTGEVARLVDRNRLADAAVAMRRLIDLFGSANTFVELQHNLVQGDTRRMARLAELAEQLKLPIVASGNVHYHQRARHRLQDAMVAIKHRATLESSHRLRRPNSEFFLRPRQDIVELFAAYPQAIETAHQIAERCTGFNLANHRDLGYEFPDFTRQEGEQESSADEVLAAYCARRFDERYPAESTDVDLRAKARQQLMDELQLVGKHHLAGFFLIYRDLQEIATDVARDVRGVGTIRGGSGLPPGRGRGSSVSSIICYLIGLSHVDPVKNRLFFRRFLNEDLQAVPDIDLDFARDIREQLILTVYRRYGHEHAALVCSFATYHLRSAVRDLGKVLGLPAPAIDKLARLSEGGSASSVRRELATLPEFQGQADGPMWAHLMDLAEQIDGFPRHVGQHVGGMIISSRPVVELVPVQPASMPGRYICQWDKDSCDDARFIKIDFLALGMLSLIEECLELIWECRDEKVDLSTIPYDDTAVYDAICNGDTVGLFQVESRAQIQMLTRTQPRNLDDLAVQVAIVRPGPIVGGAVNPYVRRRELLREDPHYVPRADHPLLDELLKDTLGIILYQDQVLEVAIELGGFTPGQADQFRRAMSRRRSKEAMERFRSSFLSGAAVKDVKEREAGDVFDKLTAFSEFGFPKSHAYAFAVLAYQSAWLRHYYPAEYYAALLNNQPMGFYAPHVLIGDARRHKLQVLRVSINRSAAGCKPVRIQPAVAPDDQPVGVDSAGRSFAATAGAPNIFASACTAAATAAVDASAGVASVVGVPIVAAVAPSIASTATAGTSGASSIADSAVATVAGADAGVASTAGVPVAGAVAPEVAAVADAGDGGASEAIAPIAAAVAPSVVDSACTAAAVDAATAVAAVAEAGDGSASKAIAPIAAAVTPNVATAVAAVADAGAGVASAAGVPIAAAVAPNVATAVAAVADAGAGVASTAGVPVAAAVPPNAASATLAAHPPPPPSLPLQLDLPPASPAPPRRGPATAEGGAIILGLTTVRGIGDDLAKAIVAERDANGPYRSLPDLLRRTGMPRNAAEHLVTIGALAEFGLGRRELLWQLGLLVPAVSAGLARTTAPLPPPFSVTTGPSREPSHGGAKASRAASHDAGGGSQIGRLPSRVTRHRQLALALPTEHDMVTLSDMSDWERMVADYGLLGLSPSYHPLKLLRPDLPADILTAEQVRISRDGAFVRTGGLVVCRQRPGTAKGFVFLLVEDETGLVNIVVRPDLYNAQRSIIRGESYLCVEGTVQLRSGSLNLLATRATPLGHLTGANGALPRAPERNGTPGNPHDKREAASAELALATPASRDFH